MYKLLITLIITILVACTGHAQKNVWHISAKDTTLVGKVLEFGSTFYVINSSRFGTRYYYGVHHLKVGVIDITDGLVKDTMILAYVYNIRSELQSYFKNFNMKIGSNYIFDIGLFSPCRSDFPKLEGRCDVNDIFFPLSNKLVTQYDKVYRVINVSKWNGSVKKTP